MNIGTGDLDIKCVNCGKDEFTVTVRWREAELRLFITCDGCLRRSEGWLARGDSMVDLKGRRNEDTL